MSAMSSEQPTSGAIIDGKHVLPLRIYHEDTDAQGVVYQPNWLRFLERGRTNVMRLMGQEQSTLRADSGLRWFVRRCTIDFLKPGRIDEVIEVVTRFGEVRVASLDVIQEIRRGDEVLVRAVVLVACVGEHGRLVRVPPEATSILAEFGLSPG